MITADQMLKLGPHATYDRCHRLAAALSVLLPAWEIDTPLRIAHFMAQAVHETDGLVALTEYASGEAYEGRSDLGNTQSGDGRLFRGRGIFQTTGRANYTRLGKALALPLATEPQRLAQPGLAVLSACIYWADHGLSALADADEGVKIGRAINRGNPNSSKPANGEGERLALIALAKTVWPAPPSQPDHSTKALQSALNRLGAKPKLRVDGDLGPLTAEAIRRFQSANGLVTSSIADGDTWELVRDALAELEAQ
ncbi:peptidoglycan-binding protein [Inquilinus sp. CA228]|uniref:peptidoglycan-binding protein n=1 Tax=Inquilinus sp. CA228 TaxID=3455609 RepID=UPI003F8D719E